MVITYNTFKYAGKFDKTVTVFTGQEGADQTVIRIRGDVAPIPMGVLEMKPRKTVFKDLKLGADNRVKLVMANTGDAPLTITKIASRKTRKVYFDGDAAGHITIPANAEKEIGITISGTDPGRFLDIIMIYSDARNDIGKGYKGVITGNLK